MKKFLWFIIIWFSLINLVWAANTGGVNLLEPSLLGQTGTTSVSTLPDYLKNIFKITIGLIGLISIFNIVLAGIKYITTGTPWGKTASKESIVNALWGILIALGAYIILHQINPDLVNFKLQLVPVAEQKTGS